MGTGEYEEVVGGGGLKLKGADVGKKKKKKKSSTSNKERQKQDLLIEQGVDSQLLPGSSSDLGAPGGGPVVVTRVEKTEAERRFEEVQKKRLAEKAKKQALKTHKDRVAAFNERLEAQSEHFDIPKVGPG